MYVNWVNGTDATRRRIRYHWSLFYKIWKSFEEVATHALSKDALVFIEWPRGCAYWHVKRVKNFLEKHRFRFASFDGCMYGLRAKGGVSDGMLINKPWRVAC